MDEAARCLGYVCDGAMLQLDGHPYPGPGAVGQHELQVLLRELWHAHQAAGSV